MASDLGVPQAWVKTIREENFGSEGTNEDLKALIAEAREVEKVITEIVADLNARAPSSKIADILSRLSKIEKDMK